MDPLKIEQLFDQVEAELKRAGSERVQLFYMQKFLVELEGNYATYDSYVIQLFQYLPDLNHPLLFTGIHPERLREIIKLCEVAVESIPELKENKEVNRKLQSLTEGLRYIEHWLKIDKEKSRDRSLTLSNFSESYEPDAGEVFIPVVESSGSAKPMGRLRKLKVEVVGPSQKKEHELRPVFGVIGANTGNLGTRSAKAAGNLLHESVGQNNFWKATAHFELSHAWHAGNSANLAMSGLFYCEMLKAENKREYFKLNPGIAITGDVDEHGNVMAVEETSLLQKTEAAFFSWVQVMVVPVQQLEMVSTYLEKMEKEFPERNLVLKGVSRLRELYFDRRITLHKQTSLAVHTAKKVWKRKNTVGFSLIVLLLLGIIGGLVYGPIDKNVEYAELKGKTILFNNSYGSTLWSLEIEASKKRFLEQNLNLIDLYKFEDITGDGINEIIWGEGVSHSSNAGGQIKAWSVTGDSLIWQQKLDLKVDFPRQQGLDELNFYVLEIDLATDRDGKNYLIARADAGTHFPGLIIKMDLLTGEIHSFYAHVGNLNDVEIIDLDNDGNDEVIICGINNAYWMASIFVLKLNEISGHSPTRGDYIMENIEPAKEHAYILVPKTIVGRVYNEVYKYSSAIGIRNSEEKEEFVVRVKDLPDRSFMNFNEIGFLLYSFDYGLQPMSIVSNDYYDVTAKSFYEEGHIPFIPDYDYWESFKDSLLYWNGQEFVHKPTINSKYKDGTEHE